MKLSINFIQIRLRKILLVHIDRTFKFIDFKSFEVFFLVKTTLSNPRCWYFSIDGLFWFYFTWLYCLNWNRFFIRNDFFVLETILICDIFALVFSWALIFFWDFVDFLVMKSTWQMYETFTFKYIFLFFETFIAWFDYKGICPESAFFISWCGTTFV